MLCHFMKSEYMNDEQKRTALMFEENGYVADLDKNDAEVIFAFKKIVTSSGLIAYTRIYSNIFTDEESFIHIYDVSDSSIDAEKTYPSFSLDFTVKTKNDLDLLHAITNLFFLFLKEDGVRIVNDSGDQFIIRTKKEAMILHLTLKFSERIMFYRKTWLNTNKNRISFKKLINEDPLVIFNMIRAGKT